MSIWDVSIELANKVYTLAYVVLVVGAILTAASTMSLFWASGVRDKYADGQIQTARTTAAIATEKAGEAQAAAARSTERGNSLAFAAEQARVEQARLKIDLTREQIARLQFESQFAWRTITQEIREKLVAALAINPGTMQIGFVSGDPESTFLALQLEQIFSAAKWQTSLIANSYPGQIFIGIFVPDSGSAGTEHARNALTSVGISFSTGKPPEQSMSFGSLGHGGERVRIELGHFDLLPHGLRESVSCLPAEVDRISPPGRRVARERPCLGFQHVPKRLAQERPAGPQFAPSHVGQLLNDIRPIRLLVYRLAGSDAAQQLGLALAPQ